jgi:hypothetical protein
MQPETINREMVQNAACRSLLLVSAVVLLTLSFDVAPSAAYVAKPDTDAPAGAAADWLPREEWVGERWLPFDETVLEAKLHMSGQEIWTYLDSTGGTIDDLARTHRLPTAGLATKLLANRHLAKRSSRWLLLKARTIRVLDQSHLAAHMLGHVFHVWSVTEHTVDVFGADTQLFNDLYFGQHLSMQEIAASQGVDAATLRKRALARATAGGARGVALGQMSSAENRVLLARDAAGYRSWSSYRVPGAASATRAFVCHFSLS